MSVGTDRSDRSGQPVRPVEPAPKFVLSPHHLNRSLFLPNQFTHPHQLFHSLPELSPSQALSPSILPKENNWTHYAGFCLHQPVRPVEPAGQTGLHDTVTSMHATVHVEQPVRLVARTSQTGLHPEINFRANIVYQTP